MGKSRERILFILLVLSKMASGQSPAIQPDSLFSVRLLSMNPRVYKSGDSTWIYSGLCKTLQTTVCTGKIFDPMSEGQRNLQVPFLKVHGNIQYDFIYRSLVD